MGAQTFFQKATGKNAAEAFHAAVSQAQYDHGHAGYSGTLAEKSNFVAIAVEPGMDPRKFAQQLIEEGDPRIVDKWGPAGCVYLGEQQYLFFGWASS